MAGDSIPLTKAGAPYRIAAVLFDFDGTLTRPGAIDFAAIRRKMDCPTGKGLLEYLTEIKDPGRRREYERVLELAEAEAADRAVPNEGAVEFVSFLRMQRIPLAIITRNRTAMVERSLRRMKGISPCDFQVVISRDHPHEPKPMPDGVFHAAETLGVAVSELLLVGDHAYDIEAGRRAGALTMLVVGEGGAPQGDVGADFIVDDLGEALQVVRYGLPLKMGKLPAEFLTDGLAGTAQQDLSLLVGAGIGEDAAALDIASDEVLVAASDPITLSAESMARYAVIINANDVAAAGARPRWLLATMMFPPGVTASEVVALIKDMKAACAARGICLCGGHTEITDAVTRPLVVGTMLGTVTAAGLIRKSRVRAGDRILLTKGVAVEGTGLIAREHATRLAAEGLSETEIERCASFLDHISVAEEATVCARYRGVSALHDVTEGGLATAVTELSTAAGFRLRVDIDAVPFYPETLRVCGTMGLDPMGLIGSGSLLITCAPRTAPSLIRGLVRSGIPATEIGRVLEAGRGVEAYQGGERVEWPSFERDEAARLPR